MDKGAHCAVHSDATCILIGELTFRHTDYKKALLRLKLSINNSHLDETISRPISWSDFATIDAMRLWLEIPKVMHHSNTNH